MCGICGFVSAMELGKDMLIRMNNSLAHRGPDDHGEEVYQMNYSRYVGFAQRRLSIMDLTEKGHQPMHSKNKRVSVIFNGEIYNYRELREEIRDYSFYSECDTEIIIAAYLKWGINFVDKLNGMFAIALFDRDVNTVYLIRDRLGIKPLFYYLDGNQNIVFASELKALLFCGLFKQEINQDIVGRYLLQNYIASPDTIYRNTYKLEQGAILKITDYEISKYKYWDVASKYNELKTDRVYDYETAKRELKALLKRAVKKRMCADVPVGAFLSGGYDSSLVCALAQEKTKNPIRTFSIGFGNQEFDEAPYAKKVARILGTNHTELYISEQDMFGILNSIPDYYDEPFADSSQIPTMLVAKLAKKDVTVVLSGDGGDEIFGGYGIYQILQRVQKWQYIGRLLYKLGKIPKVQHTRLWQKRTILYRILSDDDNRETKTQVGVNNYINTIKKLLIHDTRNFYYEAELKYEEKRYDTTRMLLDLDTYLPEDILAKVDRATMRYALECRCPFLDKEVIEYSFRLSPDFKVTQTVTKRILKDLTYEYIPKEIMDRPKAGFAIPQDQWIRHALKNNIMDWSNREYLNRQGIFDADAVQSFLSNYMINGDQGKWSGKNYSRIVWAYFIFQQWYDRYIERGNYKDGL